MAVLKASTTIRKDKHTLYSLFKNMEYFPRFISGIESLHTRRLGKNFLLSRWRINIDGTIVTWEEEDSFDDENLTVRFRMKEGDYGAYEGSWRFIEKDKGTEVRLIAKVDWSLAGLSEETRRSLDRKAAFALRWMLREIRRNAELPKFLTLESFWESKTPIVSEEITFRNRRGMKIVGFFDHLQNATTKDCLMMIPPGYGDTKRDALTTSYYLVKNGFNVIRYDATDHIGESEGEIIHTTMTKMKQDLLSAIDFVEGAYGIKKIGVVASSLAKRVAVKAASEDDRIAFLLGIVGVVNLQHTLFSVYNEDIIEDVKKGKIKDLYDVMGFQVDKEYPLSAIRDQYHDLLTTMEDLKAVRVPVVFLVAENDAWVKLEDVKLVVESSKENLRELHIIPEAMHQLFENPKAARVAMKQIVASAFKHLKQREISLDQVAEPSLREMAVQNRLEKERLRKRGQISS